MLEADAALTQPEDVLAGLALALWDAERGATTVPPPSEELPGLTIADAYDVQRRGRRLRLEAGDRLVGRKVGLTSRAMQEMLGVDQPDYGALLASMVLRSGDTVAAGRLVAPRVEAEIAFVLGRDLAGPDVTLEDVLAATREVLPALEVVDSRVEDWRITIVDTIADNASSGIAVIGEGRSPDGLDLASVEMTMRAGSHVESGRGDAVLGHPAEPVAWLARALAAHGEGLSAGDLILPGALARAVPVEAGDEARADFGPLGSVSATFG